MQLIEKSTQRCTGSEIRAEHYRAAALVLRMIAAGETDHARGIVIRAIKIRQDGRDYWCCGEDVRPYARALADAIDAVGSKLVVADPITYSPQVTAEALAERQSFCRYVELACFYPNCMCPS